jgi:hypothetical protein
MEDPRQNEDGSVYRRPRAAAMSSPRTSGEKTLEIPALFGRKADIRERPARLGIGHELLPFALVEPAALAFLRLPELRERSRQRLRKGILPLRFILKSRHVRSFRAGSSPAQ